MIKICDLQKQYQGLRPELDQAMQEVLDSAAFVGGPVVQRFEKAFADYHNMPFCVGVGNGTDALEIALRALNLPAASEVLVPAFTFIGSSEAVTSAGYKPVFCDIHRETYTLNVEDAARRITARTAAIMPVHLYGHPCDMDGMLAFAQKHGLKVVEDCAQAHGALYKGRKVGTFGDAACFSFYPGKNLGAYGDGGAILVHDEQLETRCRQLANHGRKERYTHVCEGRNSRLDALQAAVLTVKLRHLDGWNEHRRQVAGWYAEALAAVDGLILPVNADWALSAYHVYCMRCQRRDDLAAFLEKQGVQTAIHYPLSLPQQEAYAHMGRAVEPLFANELGLQILSLPMGEHLDRAEVEQVSKLVKRFYQK